MSWRKRGWRRKGRRAGFGDTGVNTDVLRNIEEYGQEEVDELEDLISTGATTAETIEQLALEVETLKGLEQMALGVLRSGVRTPNGRSSTGSSMTI